MPEIFDFVGKPSYPGSIGTDEQIPAFAGMTIFVLGCWQPPYSFFFDFFFFFLAKRFVTSATRATTSGGVA